MATRAYKEHRAATRPIREDGPEADGARRWAREVRGLTKAAGAPLRRCPAPGCFTITAALCCPTCRTVIAEPETDQGPELRRLHPAGPRYADYHHDDRACQECGKPYTPKAGNQRFCSPCGMERMNGSRPSVKRAKARRGE